MEKVISRKKTETRRRILEAATLVFEREGLAQASMRKIAKEAGFTTGSIYSLFTGKEAIYVALLAESLDRLNQFVTDASEQADSSLDALVASVSAFYTYYMSNVFEANLGMYIYGMGQVRSMGREQDSLLNQKLLKTVDTFAVHLEKLAPKGLSNAQAKAWVTAERDQIFTMLIGLLTMHQSGRAKSIGTTADAIFENHIAQLKERYIA